MAIEILRLMYAVWTGGLIFLLIHGVSRVMFAKNMSAWLRLGVLMNITLLAAVWPIAVFSPEGRKILWSKLEHF